VDLFSAIVTLLLVMDPLGNIPVFLSVLKAVPPERRRLVLAREIGLAYLVLLVFLLIGDFILRVLGSSRRRSALQAGSSSS
jgi:multiple antibiotic resistance protein